MISISPPQPFDLLIVGASARAAACSALRAGLSPCCLDLYCDQDLRHVAACRRLRTYADLLPGEPHERSLPVIFVGGMEHQLDLLREIEQTRPLWGNGPDVIRKARDLELLQEVSRLSRIGFPECRPSESPPVGDGTWLIKPVFGSGGSGVAVWEGKPHPSCEVPHFFQKFVAGDGYSATFIADPQGGDVRFVGVTRQLVGEPASHAAGPFQWCGNIGPVALPVTVEHLIRRFGNVMKWKAGLRGLFGIDFVLTADGTPCVLEVNPRYPASLELLEHATGRPLLGDHCRCFTSEPLPAAHWQQPRPEHFLGKAILYSDRAGTLLRPLADPSQTCYQDLPEIADLPSLGQWFVPGEPVCTVFATGESTAECRENLLGKLAELQRMLVRAMAEEVE